MTPFKILPVRFEEKTYKMLRKLAFRNETTMAEIIRDMVNKKLGTDKKELTDKDI